MVFNKFLQKVMIAVSRNGAREKGVRYTFSHVSVIGQGLYWKRPFCAYSKDGSSSY